MSDSPITRLHPDEVRISAELVRKLIIEQQPSLAGLDLRPSPAQGTDNVVFRLGDDLAVRLPRKPGAVPSLLAERDWLGTIAAALPLAVPAPVAAGVPSEDYPFPWLICRWVPGAPLSPEDPVGLTEPEAAALAWFVTTLQAQPSAGGPPVADGSRAGPLGSYQHRAEQAIAQLAELMDAGRSPDVIDLDRVAEVWQEAVEARPWDRPGVWVHRDLIALNLLRRNDLLHGVIDFGGLALGDPAGNLMTIFHVLPAPARRRFAVAVSADDDAYARARGWALVQGLEALPYYLDTHPAMVAMARRVIAAALAEE